jgi:hypothetical protein
MPRRPAARKKKARRSRRFRFSTLVPSAQTRRRWVRAFRRAPAGLQLAFGAVLMLSLWLALNWVYQVVRKPSELFFPMSAALYRTPTETWDAYGSAFRKHSTATITPTFLAALAQLEGSGNPIARTYWRWSLRAEPFEMYRPASSAVGMYQITDGTFEEARRYCIHDHAVVEDGAWNDPHSCWFNGLYTRTIATHSIEMTSAYLDRAVTRGLARHGVTRSSVRQRQTLAALIHLCGAGAGERYVGRGLRLTPGQRCGDHDAGGYIARVTQLQRVFDQLAAQD